MNSYFENAKEYVFVDGVYNFQPHNNAKMRIRADVQFESLSKHIQALFAPRRIIRPHRGNNFGYGFNGGHNLQVAPLAFGNLGGSAAVYGHKNQIEAMKELASILEVRVATHDAMRWWVEMFPRVSTDVHGGTYRGVTEPRCWDQIDVVKGSAEWVSFQEAWNNHRRCADGLREQAPFCHLHTLAPDGKIRTHGWFPLLTELAGVWSCLNDRVAVNGVTNHLETDDTTKIMPYDNTSEWDGTVLANSANLPL